MTEMAHGSPKWKKLPFCDNSWPKFFVPAEIKVLLSKWHMAIKNLFYKFIDLLSKIWTLG